MGKQPDPWRSLAGEIVALKKLVKEITSRSPFFGTGMKPDGQGAIQSTNFDGSLADRSAGTKGWALGPDSAALGDLILRPGSIGNDALTTPVIQNVARNRVTGFGLTTSYVELAGVDIVVPALCTQVQATVNASVFSYNPNTTGGSNGTGGDAYYVVASLGGQSTDGDEPLGVSGSGGYTTVRTADTFNIPGLTPGQVIRLSVYGASAYAPVAANAANVAKVSAGLSFLR